MQARLRGQLDDQRALASLAPGPRGPATLSVTAGPRLGDALRRQHDASEDRSRLVAQTSDATAVQFGPGLPFPREREREMRLCVTAYGC